MINHFEDLWEQCEKFSQQSSLDTSSSTILDEVAMKVNLYKLIDEKSESINEEEKKKVKSRLLGEILLSLTNLSLKDNINVFDALNTAYQYKSIGFYSNKYDK